MGGSHRAGATSDAAQRAGRVGAGVTLAELRRNLVTACAGIMAARQHRQTADVGSGSTIAGVGELDSGEPPIVERHS